MVWDGDHRCRCGHSRPCRCFYSLLPSCLAPTHPPTHPQKLYCPLPVVHITAVQAKDVRRAGVYSAPIYRGKARTGLRYIDQLQLRTDQPAAKWVLRGAAVLCSPD